MLNQHDDWKLDNGYSGNAEKELDRISDLADWDLVEEIMQENGQDLPSEIREALELWLYNRKIS